MNKKNPNKAVTIPSPLERARVRLKVCGMKYQDNIEQVAALQPDYLGFIFYEKSARCFDGENIPELPKNIKKVGVFVDEAIDVVIEKINTHKLQAVQLHGDESPEYCLKLKRHFEGCQFERSREQNDEVISTKETDCINSLQKSHKDENLKSVVSSAVEIIKVFSIKDEFNFNALKPYETVCNYFLFDTKGKLPGGNGYTFNWNVLNKYPSTKPFFLSGGIGLDEVEKIKEFTQSEASKYCYALDVNSKFEIKPGLKNIELLNYFTEKLKA